MELRSWFEGITIEPRDLGYLSGFRSNPVDMVEVGNVVYSVIGSGWQGFVVGGILMVHEDDGELNEPSKLLEGNIVPLRT